MKKLNVIIVYNNLENKILMCKREKEPYKGKYNLVGGKLEEGENELDGAYRELEEETGITSSDISLKHVMNFDYKKSFIGFSQEEVKKLLEQMAVYQIPKE